MKVMMVLSSRPLLSSESSTLPSIESVNVMTA